MRVGPTLPDTIHPNQNGYVPGRTIHDTVDLFDVAQVVAELDCDQATVIALLFDFRKAYDSLARDYLHKVLQKKGYPAKFIKAVRYLHTGIAVRFITNGDKSRCITVTNEIRQGCPLAPQLFILALDLLYHKIDTDQELPGIHIRSAGGEFELRVGGYADDTTSYLQSALAVPRLLQVTDQFGQDSGLCLNEEKTMVIALNAHVSRDDAELPPPLRFQEIEQHGRYLGLQVGSQKDPEATWRIAQRQTIIRLHLASQKKHTHNSGPTQSYRCSGDYSQAHIYR